MSLFIKSLRVLIVEDHELFIDGIRNLLSTQPRYDVVGAVCNGLTVYEACQRLTPDMVLLDLALPGMDGLDVIHQLIRRWEKLKIVVITAFSEECRGLEVLAAGAFAYVLKQSPKQTLLAAMQHSAIGKRFVDPALRLGGLESTEICGAQPSLTPRERQVLKLVAEGKRNRDIAELLSISLKTVETHRLHLMRKLNAHNAVELNNWARRLGFLEF
ncbi:two component system response regulator [Salmonella enterica]|nr:DNA-binding response regulator [Salmonella enterica subsp. enterica serovar Sandiego]EEC0251371.1 two component system response regulator [Salmonella enterica subsp. enterica]EJW2128683.1 two component system response regulator [Salmonella enterica]EEE4266743.1 two component system response regulator [Salmonella enterica subsp. enterica serovar Sandiego]EKT1704575.1 two component system response regulator [Salmonella enterica]